MRIPTFGQFQNAAELIGDQYSNLGKLQQQAMTGHKLLSPTDDSVLASQLQSLQDYINQMDTYSHNGAVATARNTLFDTTNKKIINAIGDVQSQLIRAQSGSVNASDKIGIANALQGDLNDLLNSANMTDQSGQYIFSGSSATSPAYSLAGNSYQYLGGANSTNIDIGPNATTLYNEVGSQVFGNIPLGNGTFTVSASGANTGSAFASAGAVVNSSQYVADTYTVSIVTNNDGVPGIQVVGATSGQIIPPSGGNAPAYVAGTGGQDINFNGLTINLSSGAKLGDTFTVQPSTKQNVFDTLQGLINTIRDPNVTGAAYTQALSQANASFTQVMSHFVSYQTTAGTREQITNNQLQTNAQTVHDQSVLKSSLGDVNIVQVFSSLMQQSIALQATQASYLKMQETLTELLKL